MKNTRVFSATANHPLELRIGNETTLVEKGTAIEFAFPIETAADREALEGWAHAMRFWSDAILGSGGT